MEELVKSVVVVSALGAFFALLLVVADALFNRYGEVTIDVNNGARKLKVRGGNSLLVGLMTQKIFIPSACGGRATCAYCKVKVTSGAGPVLPKARSASVDNSSLPSTAPGTQCHSKLPMRARSCARASLALLRSSSERVRAARSR